MAVNKFEKAFAKDKKTTTPANDTTKVIAVGESLLNDVSKAVKPKEMDIIYLTPEQIYPSPDNEISMNQEEIAELANSLVEVGMINPLVVRATENDTYRIVCGERRYRATLLNIENGLRDKDTPIKCSLFNSELIDLPLSDDEKEDYVRDVENAQQRNKTDGDKMMLMRKFEARYAIMKERDPERFKGIKTRDLLAQDMDISPSTVAQFKKVENQGSEALKKAMVDGNINITAAVDVAGMEPNKQEDLINKVLAGGNSKITKKDVQKYEFEQKHDSDTPETELNPEQEVDDNTVLITEKRLKSEMKDIFKRLKEKGGVKIDKDELLTLLNKIRDIEKLLSK